MKNFRSKYWDLPKKYSDNLLSEIFMEYFEFQSEFYDILQMISEAFNKNYGCLETNGESGNH